MIEKILAERLRSYMIENNLDVLLQLQDGLGVTAYLENKVMSVQPQVEQWIAEGKPQYVLEELAMNDLTADLRPSRFNYIRMVLEDDFLQTYKRFRELGVLTYEAINIIVACKPVFDAIGFTEESEDNRSLRYAIIGMIEEYLTRPTG